MPTTDEFDYYIARGEAGVYTATCDAALVPLNSDPIEPCVKPAEHAQGDDKVHETAEGRRWRDPLDEES